MRALLLTLLVACGGGEPRPASLAAPAPSDEPRASSPKTDPSGPSGAVAAIADDAPTGAILTVEMLDIGQGDAILLRTPGGKTVLIDAGTGNQGESALPLLEQRGISRLDMVVGTHPHSDHVGGLDEVLAKLPARLYLDNGLPHSTDTYDRLMEVVESRKIPYKAAKMGQTFNLDSGAKLVVLSPTGTPITGTRSDLNANSVVIRATYGEACVLLVGDAEEETEHQLLANTVEPCDILKVAHHGSAYASTPEFLAAVLPRVALISVGTGNEYGHPTPETLERLKTAGARVFRTDQLGTVKVETDGKTALISSERGEPFTLAMDGAAPTASATTGTDARPGAGALVNLNTATAAELETLPGVGAALAADIVSYRKKNGPFRSVEQLDQVPGIGPATLEKLDGLVTVR